MSVTTKEPNIRPTITTVQPTFLERSLTVYLSELANALRSSEKVTSHTILKSETWTKSCYDLLAKLISADLIKNLNGEQRMQMGTSLSSKTLQKIIDLTYKLSYPIDPRTLNTLNKLVIFLGHKDWDTFIKSIDKTLERETTPAPATIDAEEAVLKVVREAVRREYLSYCNLPERNEKYLTDFYIKDSAAYNMIMDMIVDKTANKQVISNAYNPSSCEILDSEVKKIEENYAQVYTKEYWLLCWWDPSQKKYIKRYKNIADHFYILEQKKGQWKIKTNASEADPMEL